MKLAPNFSLKELTASQTAERLNIRNEPDQQQLVNLVHLCTHVLQPVREHYGKVVTVSSGLRVLKLNKAIGSSDKSQHVLGQACDFEIYGLDNHLVAQFIAEKLDYDKLILEFYTPPNGGWIHVSYDMHNNRKEIMTASRDSDGKVHYNTGFNV